MEVQLEQIVVQEDKSTPKIFQQPDWHLALKKTYEEVAILRPVTSPC